MINFFRRLFNKQTPSIDTLLPYPEGKRYYRDSHSIRKNNIDEDALKIIHRLNRFKYKSFIVGGCIRDILLGRKPKDFDVVTTATPNQIKSIFNNCRIIGKRFKIVHVIFKGKTIEVSTFRSLPDHRLEKHGENKDYLLKKDNNYGTPKEDAARRDFTINALYYDPRNECIIDFVGGLEDIQNKILRVIGDPNISFKEDPVRMLRAIKFSVLHGLEIEKNTKQAIKKNKLEILKSSNVRLLEEYNKIFKTTKTANIFSALTENYLLEVLYKEVIDNIKKKEENWREDFINTSVGRKLSLADKMLNDRQDISSIIYYSILFSELVASKKSESSSSINHIRTSLDKFCERIGFPKRDKDRLIKIYISQARFLAQETKNQVQNEIFKKKDYFQDAFTFFKISAEVDRDEVALQSALYWEISAMNTRKPNIKNKDKKDSNFKGKFGVHKKKGLKKNNFKSPNKKQNPYKKVHESAAEEKKPLD